MKKKTLLCGAVIAAIVAVFALLSLLPSPVEADGFKQTVWSLFPPVVAIALALRGKGLVTVAVGCCIAVFVADSGYSP